MFNPPFFMLTFPPRNRINPSLNGGKDTVSSASAVSKPASLDSAGRDNFGKALDTKVAPIVEANSFLGLTCFELTKMLGDNKLKYKCKTT